MILQFFSTADNITAIAVASFVLVRAGTTAWRRTLGSRRVTARAIRSLTPGNPIELVEGLFGQHIYSHTYSLPSFEGEGKVTEYNIEQRLYNARHGWLTVHYNTGKVSAFAFMLTDKRFRFRLDETCRGMVTGTLGRSTFQEICNETPSILNVFTGAYNWGYSEIHYYGRPGNYQHYAFSNTMFGWSAKRTDFDGIFNLEVAGHFDRSAVPNSDLERLKRYRRGSAPDTVAVFGLGHGVGEPAPGSGSYDQDDMRNLEGSGPKGWRSRSSFDRRERRLLPIRRIQWWYRARRSR